MDWTKVIEKISKETSCDKIAAEQMIEQIQKINKELRPVVSAWVKDELIGYNLNGITLDTIMEKERITYIQAVFSMSTLLDNPDFAAMYLEFPFDADYMEG
jgi:hypothetical protein